MKIKLEGIICFDILGRKRFLLLTLAAIFVSLSFSGVSGLAIFLNALRRLLKEGQISLSLYKRIFREITRRKGWIPENVPDIFS